MGPTAEYRVRGRIGIRRAGVDMSFATCLVTLLALMAMTTLKTEPVSSSRVIDQFCERVCPSTIHTRPSIVDPAPTQPALLECPSPCPPQMFCPVPRCPPYPCPEQSCPEPICPPPQCPQPDVPPCPNLTCPRPVCPEPKCPRPECPQPICHPPTCPQPTPPECPKVTGISGGVPACRTCPWKVLVTYNLFPGFGYYKGYKAEYTWAEANETCVGDGGHLGIINSQAEADIYAKLYHQNKMGGWIFVGFHDLYVEGQYVTVEGVPLHESGYFRFQPGEPNDLGRNEDCGTIDSKGLLNDGNCEWKTSFICEYPEIQAPGS